MAKSKGDHKRVAVALPPAKIIIDESGITAVVPDVLGKNASHKTGKNGRRFTSEQTDAYRASIVAGRNAADTIGHFLAHSGAWRLEVIGVWPKERHEIKGFAVDFKPCPLGDADAAIPQALDALMTAGIIDDDARVVEVRAWNLYRRDVRATVIRLSRVSLETRDAALAHLAHLVPPAKDPPPKPARASKRRKAATT